MRRTSIGKVIGETFLFSTYLESDIRTPLVTFPIPSFLATFLGGEYHSVKLGFILPSLEFWIAVLTVLLLGSMFNTILAILSYHLIVLQRKQQEEYHKKKDGEGSATVASLTPYLFGFGVIMPLATMYPYYCIHFFGVQNKVLKFFFGVQSLTTFFRCLETMFGYLPNHVDDSLFNMIVYNLFPVETKYDANGPLKSTWAEVWHYANKFGLFVLLLGGYCSLLSPYDYEPFTVGDGSSFLDAGQLANNGLVALLFQLYLTTDGFGIFTVTSLCGVQQGPMMLNPIFESASPSDFWGRRWNLVVHGLLKRGVYKPVRSRYSRFVASMAAFLASGFFHEWMLSVVYLQHDSSLPDLHSPTYGRNTAFFVWNAIVIGLEYMIGGAVIFQVLKNNLPPVIVSLLVTLTALPMAHWFTFDYVKDDFFHDGQIGFPMVKLQT